MAKLFCFQLDNVCVAWEMEDAQQWWPLSFSNDPFESSKNYSIPSSRYLLIGIRIARLGFLAAFKVFLLQSLVTSSSFHLASVWFPGSLCWVLGTLHPYASWCVPLVPSSYSQEARWSRPRSRPMTHHRLPSLSTSPCSPYSSWHRAGWAAAIPGARKGTR